MKKVYTKPALRAVPMEAAEVICTSTFPSGGGDGNISITPSEGEYNGNFQSHGGGWNSSDWSGEE